MIAVISLLIVLTLLLLITRIATVALTLTGLSSESARFQARSAFSGTGFTTSEAEAVMNHPVRRRIVMALMLVGNAGIVTAVASLLLSFTGASDSRAGLVRGGVLLGGLAVLWAVARSRLANRWLSRFIERMLRRLTHVDARDYAALLRLEEDWMVAELEVEPDDWMAERELGELDLPHEGVLVLGIHRRDGRWIGAPRETTRVHPGDAVMLYGRREMVEALDERPRGAAGEAEHEAFIRRFRSEIAAETEPDVER